jgi:hypothetical protein
MSFASLPLFLADENFGGLSSISFWRLWAVSKSDLALLIPAGVEAHSRCPIWPQP